MAYVALRSSVFLISNSVYLFVLCSATISNPRNTAVVAGQKMEMKCRNDSGQSFRSWQTHRISDEQEQTIFQYKGQGSHFPQFGIDRTSPGSVTLYSNSTLSSDAGVYRCTSFDSDTSALVTYSAHLIVIESNPECQTDLRDQVIVKGSSITIRCIVRFKGNMIPQIEWRQSEFGTPNSAGQSVAHGESSSDNGHIISTLNLIVDFHQPRIFTFKTFFLSTSTSSGDDYAAVNAPDYTYTWTSIPIGVTSLSSSIAPSSSQTLKSSRPDDNVGESLKLSVSTVSATATDGESKISFVFEHWILISVCVGVAVLASVIVAAIFSYSRYLKKKRKAKAHPVNEISMPQFANYVDMQRYADTYCSIGDDLVCEGNTAAAGVSPQVLLAQRSLSAPGCSVRTLPRPPPAQPAVENPSYYIQPTYHADKRSQRTNTMSHNTRQNGQRGIGFTSTLSTSLPTIYQEEEDSVTQIKNKPRVPVQIGRREPEASSYLAAQDVLVDEDSDMNIPSMYLGVNKLSERNS